MDPDYSGHMIGERYSLIKRIGHGGMSTVYEAVDHELDKQVAVKVLHAHLTDEAEYVARFRQEAKVMARIRHPHIVDVTDLGVTNEGVVYFVMEYLDGESLSELLQEHPGPLPWRMAVEIAIQVCEALEAAHERGIIHRDVKPGNCYLMHRPHNSRAVFVKLLDFGISKVRDEYRDPSSSPITPTTCGVPGTPEYMAPEMVRGDPHDHRIDIYALGIILYRLLTGQLPFHSPTSPYLTLEKQCKEEPVAPRLLCPEIPVPLERVVLRALSKAPEGRYARAAELSAALAEASGAESMLSETMVLVPHRALGESSGDNYDRFESTLRAPIFSSMSVGAESNHVASAILTDAWAPDGKHRWSHQRLEAVFRPASLNYLAAYEIANDPERREMLASLQRQLRVPKFADSADGFVDVVQQLIRHRRRQFAYGCVLSLAMAMLVASLLFNPIGSNHKIFALVLFFASLALLHKAARR